MSVSRQFAPALDDAGFVGMQGTPTPGHLRYTGVLGFDYSVDEAQRTGPDGRPLRIDRRLRTDVSVQLGIGARLAVAATIPVVLHQASQEPVVLAVPPSTRSLASTGLGDVRLQSRYRLLGTVADRTGVKADGPGLGVLFALDVPTGDPKDHTGEHGARTEVAALADFQVLGAGAGVKVGWLHRAVPNHVAGFELADRLVYGAAVRMPMPFFPPLSALVELRGEADFISSEGSPVELLLGGRLRAGDWTLGLSGGLGLATPLGQPGGRVMVYVRMSPPDPDTDGDGVPDGSDGCPFLPEDLDGFEDGDGCEDPDNDNDMVPDVDDLCPNEEALVDRDDNEDGCTDPE
ncbi:MAG: hypothetical protein OXU20_06585 [Myxococcales bacterium]|nr:hypothetical protein [Myxococcales bacterium]MDD9968631.1 hypothetical protein [Myxococcales bacterium]